MIRARLFFFKENMKQIFDDNFLNEINLPVINSYKKRRFDLELNKDKLAKFRKRNSDSTLRKNATTISIQQKANKINRNLNAIINNIDKLTKVWGDCNAKRC